MSVVRREWGNLLLLGLALLSSTWLAVPGALPAPGVAERTHSLLPAFQESNVRKLEIERGSNKITLERELGADPEWLMRQPSADAADDAALKTFLSSVALAVPVRRIPVGEERPEYQLATPRAKLRITQVNGTCELALGAAAPSPAGAAYVRVNCSSAQMAAFVVKADVVEWFDGGPERWLETKIFPHNLSQAKRLELVMGSSTLSLEQSAQQWLLVAEGKRERAARAAVEGLLAALERQRFEQSLDLAQAEAALANGASFTLRASFATENQEFAWGGKCPVQPDAWVALRRGKHARAACTAAEFPSSYLDVQNFRDDHLLAAHADEIESLKITTPAQNLWIERKGENFQLREPSERRIELEAGNQRLKELANLRGSLEPHKTWADIAVTPVPAKLVLQANLGKAERVEEVLRVGQQTRDDVFVLREMDGRVLRVAKDRARVLFADATLLKPKRLLEFGPSAFSEARVVAGPMRQTLRRTLPSVFALEEPAGFNSDGLLAAELVQSLGALDAERWVADSDDGSFGLETPSALFSIEFTRDNAAEKRVLTLGKAAPGGIYGKLDHDAGVFVLPRRVLVQANTWLIDRNILQFEPNTLERVSIQSPRKKLELFRRGEQWLAAPGSVLNPGTQETLIEALLALRAEAAVRVGPVEARDGLASPVLTIETRDASGHVNKLQVGARDVYRDANVYFARVSGVNATFALIAGRVQGILELIE